MSNYKPKILLAEDDLHLGMLLSEYLLGENLDVKLCRDGLLAMQAIQSTTFDLCLLDVMMPKMDGFTLAKEIRKKNSEIPIIFITAKSQKLDKVKGYDIGGDDYITKPFDEEELLWKIKARLRHLSNTKTEIKKEPIPLGNFQIDFYNQSISFDGAKKRMTEKESKILNYLYTHRNSLVKREEILMDIYGRNDYFDGRSLDVFITKIRKYLKDDSRIVIENVFGVGFILNSPN